MGRRPAPTSWPTPRSLTAAGSRCTWSVTRRQRRPSWRPRGPSSWPATCRWRRRTSRRCWALRTCTPRRRQRRRRRPGAGRRPTPLYSSSSRCSRSATAAWRRSRRYSRPSTRRRQRQRRQRPATCRRRPSYSRRCTR